MSSDIQGAILVGLLGLGVAALMWRVLHAVWREHCPNITPLGKIGTIALLLAVAAVGGDKSPAARALATLVTVLRSGELLDPSGRIVASAQLAAMQTAADLAASIVDAASNTVAHSQSQFDAIATRLTNRAFTVAYVSGEMPRAVAGVYTNHNIAGNLFYERDGPTNLTAYVWFSEVPELEPSMSFPVSYAAGSTVVLSAWTNSYPSTVEYEGLPCYAYQVALPAYLAGMPLKPDLDVRFGGPDGEPLIVPAGGVVVATNGVEHFPFSGTDVYSPNLSVTYKGGIAVSAVYHGTNYTGGVTL